MNDALGSDVHPTAGGHLAVVGHAHGGGPVEARQIVKFAHHEAVGNDHPGGHFVAAEEAQGVTGHHHQSLLVRQGFQIFLNQAILHPVLAHLAGLAVGHQLIGIQGHVKIQVVVNHHLEGLALGAVALVFVNGLAVDGPGGTEAVAVDPAVLLQLLGKLLGHGPVVLLRDVTQGVGNGQLPVVLTQLRLPPGSPADAGDKGGIFRQVPVQLKNFRIQIHGVTS